jgi:hypothetical protein
MTDIGINRKYYFKSSRRSWKKSHRAWK